MKKKDTVKILEDLNHAFLKDEALFNLGLLAEKAGTAIQITGNSTRKTRLFFNVKYCYLTLSIRFEEITLPLTFSL